MGVLVAGGLTGLLNQSSAQVIDGSLKFDKTSSTYLTRTPASAGNRKVWTLSYWIKLSGDGGHLLSANNDAFQFEYRTTGELLFANSGSTSGNTSSTAKFRDPSAFYNVTIHHDATNLAADVYINGTLNFTATLSNADGTWNNNTSHNINGRSTSNDSYSSFAMSQVYFIDGLALGPGYFGFTDPLTNTWRPKKFRAEGTTANDGTTWSSYGDGNAASSYEWTHAFDGSFGANDYVTGTATYTTITFPEAIQAENIYLFLGTGTTAGLKINGVQITDVVGAYNNSARYKVGSNGEGNFLKTISLYNSGTQWSILYAIEVGGVLMRDGITQNLAFGTNGFYLPMDNDDFHIDKSGNGNNWTKQNFSGTFNDPDVLKDSPSGAVSGGRAQTGITTTSSAPSNYCTLNPLDTTLGGNLQDGNLKAVGSSNWSVSHARGTFALTYGKWFWEGTKSGGGSTGQFGFANSSANLNESYSSAPANSWTFYFGNGTEIIVPAANSGGYFSGSAMTNGDTAGVALDMDNGTWQFFKNGVGGAVKTLVDTDSGSTVSITELYPYVGSYDSNIDLNFGQKPFKYAPPQGFLPLNSASATPETVITRPDQFVGTTLYSGTGSTKSVTGVGHSPDLLWTKARGHGDYHTLVDSVRGTSKTLYSNATDSEGTDATGVTSFDRDGFSLGANSTAGSVNVSGRSYVAWTWKAGGNKNTFNVDDVGYASASDVNMSVGALNSSLYNTSQVWSDDVTKGTGNVYSNNIYVPANIFNGNTSSYCRVEKGSNSNTVSMQLSSTISGVTKIRVNTNSVDNFNINGGANIAATNGYQTIYEGSAITLSDLDFTRTNGVSSGNSDTALFVYSIEINGLELLDSGVTPSSNFPSIAATGASVGTRQGFSIIKYQGNGTAGANISHGLLEAPKLMIHKSLDQSRNWYTITTAVDGSSDYLYLNLTNAANNSTVTAPTSSLMYFTSSAESNNNNENYVVYMWHDVPGLQKFGTYEGSGSPGNYVHLGFRPALIWIKNVDSTAIDNWGIIDSTRSYANVGNHTLATNLASAESAFGDGSSVFGANNKIDLLSNGFTLQEGSGFGNTSGITFLYCAWAEAPTFNLFGGQSNAR